MQCTKCKEDKLDSEFSKLKHRLNPWCKKCVVANSRKWAMANKERVNKRSREWNKANPEKRKATGLKLYNLTLDQFKQMVADQHSCCKICGIHSDDCKKGLAVDHDHITGKVRGLLCGNCNRGIGYLKDSTQLLKTAISYLEG